VAALFQSYGLWKIGLQCSVQVANAVQEIRNPCRKYENAGIMMWAISQDTWQKTIINKTYYREV